MSDDLKSTPPTGIDEMPEDVQAAKAVLTRWAAGSGFAEARAVRTILSALEKAKDDGQMASGCLDMVHEFLARILGVEAMRGTPAMMYPEAIETAIVTVRDKAVAEARAESASALEKAERERDEAIERLRIVNALAGERMPYVPSLTGSATDSPCCCTHGAYLVVSKHCAVHHIPDIEVGKDG